MIACMRRVAKLTGTPVVAAQFEENGNFFKCSSDYAILIHFVCYLRFSRCPLPAARFSRPRFHPGMLLQHINELMQLFLGDLDLRLHALRFEKPSTH